VEVRVERAAAPEPEAPSPALGAELMERAFEPVEDDEPVPVRVTIGRVELRAAAPAPAPRPAAPQSGWSGPSLSLDDYLAQRNGGRR
jgi:hypothetical protein